ITVAPSPDELRGTTFHRQSGVSTLREPPETDYVLGDFAQDQVAASTAEITAVAVGGQPEASGARLRRGTHRPPQSHFANLVRITEKELAWRQELRAIVGGVQAVAWLRDAIDEAEVLP